MFHKTGTALAIASALTLGLLSSAQAATDEPAMELDAQTVLGDDSPKQVDDYRAAASRSATRLELAPRETPQSVSTMTRAQMDDFQLDSIKDVLKYSTGVAVEEVETDRTYFTARGFDVTNFQYDGIGVPFIYGGMDGDIDTALFERIEILRGANGLMSGIGNPSATVNFVRKRPTVTPQARIDLATGSWDKRRLDTDVSGALNADGSLRGRLVYAHEQKNSWLDRYGREKNVFLGVVEMDLDDATVLTLGHSMQKTDADSPMWGALPLNFSDGSPTDYARSTSTSADWAYWNNRELRTFAELSRQLGGDWQVKGVLTRVEHDNDGRLFYVYGTPDRDTGLGLFSYPSLYSAENLQHLADLYASGPFQLGGREHELVVGASASKSELQDISHYGRGIGTALPPLQDWSGDYPLPPFDASVAGSEFTDRQRSGYAAVRLNLLDDLKLIAGARVIDVDNRGTSYGKSKSTAYHGKTVPYAGLVYDLNADYALYASYTGIFKMPAATASTPWKARTTRSASRAPCSTTASTSRWRCSRPARTTSPSRPGSAAGWPTTAPCRASRAVAGKWMSPASCCPACRSAAATPSSTSAMRTAGMPVPTPPSTWCVACWPTACRSCRNSRSAPA